MKTIGDAESIKRSFLKSGILLVYKRFSPYACVVGLVSWMVVRKRHKTKYKYFWHNLGVIIMKYFPLIPQKIMKSLARKILQIQIFMRASLYSSEVFVIRVDLSTNKERIMALLI